MPQSFDFVAFVDDKKFCCMSDSNLTNVNLRIAERSLKKNSIEINLQSINFFVYNPKKISSGRGEIPHRR